MSRHFSKDSARQPLRPAAPLTIAALLWSISSLILLGAAPVFWTVSTQTDFLEGDIDSLSVDADGHLRLGPTTSPVFETSAPTLWSLTNGTDGGIWIGSGNQGRLYHINSSGDENVAFDANELDLYAVEADPAGGVYFASSPDGRVYHSSEDGPPTILFDPTDTYIWSVAPGPNGVLYVGTGNPARVYRLPAEGDAEVLLESDAAHVLSLAVADNGDVLAGTESPGQVVRIDSDGRTFVLLDSPYEEVRALRPQPDGSILAVAVSSDSLLTGTFATSGSGSAPIATVSVTTSVTAVAGNSMSTNSTPTATSAGRSLRGAVYRIEADGLWDVLWRSDTDTPFDAVYQTDGSLVIGTGPDGKIFKVSDTPPRTLLLGRAPARHVTRFLKQPDGSLRYATANPGKLMTLPESPAPRGTYISEVRDASTVARWGTLSWRGSTPGTSAIELTTRSGNTEIPNNFWSDWSVPYTDSTGSQIVSPNARYLQWRVSLEAGDAIPVLTSVTAAYLPRNFRPEITQLTVHPPGTVFQRALSTGDPPLAGLDDPNLSRDISRSTTLGRESYRKGIQTFAWRATDQNADPLDYTISAQKEGEASWRILASGLRNTVFAWDTSRVPDGAYRIRIAASDALTNEPASALVGERDSPVFDVDNTAPTITVGAVQQTTASSILPFVVRDGQSPIQLVEVSQGDEVLRLIYPIDGIPDGLIENFEFFIDPSVEGTVLIRATDALSNTVTVSTQAR